MPQVACSVVSCSNNSAKLQKVKNSICEHHSEIQERCGCPLPYQHYAFPKDAYLKDSWIKLINRKNDNGKLWTPKPYSVVCNHHFIDGKPTEANSLPTLKLGYKPTGLVSTQPRQASKRNVANVGANTCTSTYRFEEKEVNYTLPDVQGKSLSTNYTMSTFDHHDVSQSQNTTTLNSASSVDPSEQPFNYCATSDDLYTRTKIINDKLCARDDVSPATYSDSVSNKDTTSCVKIKYEIIGNMPGEKSTIDNREIQKKVTGRCKRPYCLMTEAKLRKLKSSLGPVHKKLLTSNQKCRFYTQIPTLEIFYLLCKYVKNVRSHTSASVMTKTGNNQTTLSKYWKWKNMAKTNKRLTELTSAKLPYEDKILMVLMKLRLRAFNEDLADRFGITTKDVSIIFSYTLDHLAYCLKGLIVFYPKSIIRKTLPKSYKQYKNLRCVIDCSEIFIQRPSDVQLQPTTWSDYKHNNTLKFLIAISPQGSISFISELWGGGGRASDRHIVTQSGFLDYIDHGDQILADRGFLIKEELLIRGAELVIPPGARGHTQMTSEKIFTTKKVANTRIHVERVIRRLKTFRILSETVPIVMLRHMNNILLVCAAITNLQPPIVSSWNNTYLD